MINTRRRRHIDYRDFYTGAGLTETVERAYIQYYNCVVTDAQRSRLR
jgi:hypothetical protein